MNVINSSEKIEHSSIIKNTSILQERQLKSDSTDTPITQTPSTNTISPTDLGRIVITTLENKYCLIIIRANTLYLVD